jgi:glycosyltransferase involved in cell wall biosynthesis
MRKIPWVAWTPIDHEPVPPKVKDALSQGYGVPVAYSQFGVQQLKQAGLAPLYVPHACHQDYFERTTKKKAREKLGLPLEAFIVGMVGVNQSVPNRKSYPQCLEAFKRFHKQHKDAFLLMHTNPDASEGLNLTHLIDHLGIDKNCYSFPEKYQMLLGFSETYLRDLYTAMDVFLTPNMGEGFGVPIIEAQACGTPIIGTDFSTMPELCFFGELVKGEPFYTIQSSFQRLPTVNEILRALKKVYDYDSEKVKKGTAYAKRSIRKHYHPDTVTQKYWQPVLESAKQRIGDWTYEENEIGA